VALLLAAAGCRAQASAGQAPWRGGAGASCTDNAECGASEYCEQSLGLCGRAQRPGTCRSRPDECDANRAPVCGCDGRVYVNECSAHSAGVDLATLGGCNAALPDWAPCGKRFCDARTSYCEIYLSDVLEPPTDYFCRDLPPSCMPGGAAPRTCDCFPDGTRCRTFCGPLPTGGLEAFHLTCQGVKPPPT
jgi:hypothetical protein